MWIPGRGGTRLGAAPHDRRERLAGLPLADGAGPVAGDWYAYYFDVGIIGREFVSLGRCSTSPGTGRTSVTGETLGYFDDADFVPEEWKSGYPNPAFTA